MLRMGYQQQLIEDCLLSHSIQIAAARKVSNRTETMIDCLNLRNMSFQIRFSVRTSLSIGKLSSPSEEDIVGLSIRVDR